MTDDKSDDHRADVLSMAANWYGCVLAARPNLLDNAAATERERHRVMKVLIADAEALTELVYGRDDDPPTLPVQPVVLSGQDEAA